MSWIPKWFLGVDVEEEQKRQNELDAQLRALNQQKLEQGRWDQATFDEAQANLDRSRIDDVSGEVDNAFKEGFDEGLDNVRGTAGGIIAFPFKLIPWQLWLIGVVALLVYMGGWAKLAGILNKGRR